MAQNHFFYSHHPSATAPLPSQSAYYLPPGVPPGTHPTNGGYNNYNSDWGPQQEHRLLHIASQMTGGESFNVGVTAATSGVPCQCMWLTAGTPCNQESPNFDELIIHLARAHDVQGSAGRMLDCQWARRDMVPCGKNARRDAYRRHMAVHLGHSVLCPGCDKSFSRKDSMLDHFKKQHVPK